MRKWFVFIFMFAALTLPHLAQAQVRLSLSDQRRFDSYYSRWQSYKATNNQSQVRSMEGRMQDVYRHYGIAANTPYRNVVSGGGGTWGNERSHGTSQSADRDRDWPRDRDQDNDRDEDGHQHHGRGQHRGWYKHHRDHDAQDDDHDR